MKQRIFYFDIDGTVLQDDTGRCKPMLAAGAFERAIRNCDFDRVVCVGNLCHIISALQEMGKQIEPMEIVFEICDSAFVDLEWMKQNLQLMKDPTERCSHIDFRSSFFYADDRAEEYLRLAKMSDIFDRYAGNQILVPDPNSTGEELLSWLEWCAGQE